MSQPLQPIEMEGMQGGSSSPNNASKLASNASTPGLSRPRSKAAGRQRAATIDREGGDFAVRTVQTALEEKKQKDKEEGEIKYVGTSCIFNMPVDHWLRSRVITVVEDRRFDGWVLFTIFMNCIALAIDDPLTDSTDQDKALETIEIIFTILFTGEALLRIIALGFVFNGPKSYLRSGWNVLDAIIILASFGSYGPFGDTNLSSLRAFRLLKSLRTISTIHSMRVLIGSLWKSLLMLSDVGMLFIFWFLVFGVTGMQLFGGKMDQRCFYIADGTLNTDREQLCGASAYPCPSDQYCDHTYRNPMRGNGGFDNIFESWLTLLACISMEGWVDTVYALWETTSYWAVLYFIALICIIGFFLTELLTGIVYTAYIAARDQDHEELKASGFIQEKEKDKDKDKKIIKKSGGRELSKSRTITVRHMGIVEAVARSAKLDHVVNILILINTLLLATEHHNQPDYWSDFLEVTNVFFTILFAIEVIWRIVGIGWEEYRQSAFNLFDTTVVVANLIELLVLLIIGNDDASVTVSIFRSLRLLRIFKLSGRWSRFRKLLDTLSGSLRALMYFGFLVLLFLFIGALIGMEFLAGKMLDEDGSVLRSNFDTFWWSFVTAFQIISGENWNDLLYASMDENGWWASFYFVLMFIFGNYVILNLFLAILLENFGEEEEEEEDEEEHFSLHNMGVSVRTRSSNYSEKKERNSPPSSTESSNDPHAPNMIALDKLPPVSDSQIEMVPGPSSRASSPKFIRPISLNGAGMRSLTDANTANDASRALPPTTTTPRSREGGTPKTPKTPQLKLQAPGYPKHISIRSRDRPLSPPLPPPPGPPSPVPPSNENERKTTKKVKQAKQVKQPKNIKGPNGATGRVNSGKHSSRFHRTRTTNSPQTHDDAMAEIASQAVTDPKHVAFTSHPFTLAHASSDQEAQMAPQNPQNPQKKDQGLQVHQQQQHQYRIVSRKYEDIDDDEELYVPGTPHHPRSPHAPHVQQPSTVHYFKLDVRGTSLCIFPPTNAFRRWCAAIGSHKAFEWFILVWIFITTVLVAIGQPDDMTSGYGNFYFYLNYLSVMIFLFEALIKIVALGFVHHPSAYLRDGWNVFDFLIALAAIIDLYADSDVGALRAIRAFRLLRPLRMINRFRSLKLVVYCMINSLPAVANVVVMAALFYVVFGILGVNLFAGKFFQCEYDGEALFVDQATCTQLASNSTISGMYQWKNPDIGNFDNVLHAILLLFEVASMEMWPEFLYRAVDVTSETGGRERDAKPAMALYFIAFLVVCSFFIMNLFVGAVVDTFSNIKESMHDEWARGGIAQAEEHSLDELLGEDYEPPIEPWRRRVFDFVDDHRFEFCILALICFNIVIMCLWYSSIDDEYEFTLEILNHGISVVFIIELILKLIAYGSSQYISSGWNRLDALVVLVSILNFIILVFGESLPLDPAVFRILRVIRIFRVLEKFEGIKTIIKTLALSASALGSVGTLFVLLMIVYTCVGIQLLKDVPYNEFVNEHVNFENFGLGMFTLFRMATGESWNGVMHEYLPRDDCTEDNGMNCGTWWAIPFFVTYVILSQYMVLNLIVAVVLSEFEARSEKVSAMVAAAAAALESESGGGKLKKGKGGVAVLLDKDARALLQEAKKNKKKKQRLIDSPEKAREIIASLECENRIPRSERKKKHRKKDARSESVPDLKKMDSKQHEKGHPTPSLERPRTLPAETTFNVPREPEKTIIQPSPLGASTGWFGFALRGNSKLPPLKPRHKSPLEALTDVKQHENGHSDKKSKHPSKDRMKQIWIKAKLPSIALRLPKLPRDG